MHLARFPRRRYQDGPTPLEPMPRLSAELGDVELWIKRDDRTGLGGGGNKTRKLEFLVADALERGADTLITVGAPQSNHCSLTAAAAAHEGLACRLVIEERVAGSYADDAVGNRILFDLFGVEAITVVPAGTDMQAMMEREADAVRADGRTPYLVPGGGSNALGSLGYAACAFETLQQAYERGVAFDAWVCASGSGGTHAGLVAGLHAASADLPVMGISTRAERTAQEAKIRDLAAAACAHAGLASAPSADAVTVRGDQVGPGYSLPTEPMRDAIGLFARTEGLLLDPVYTGKAAAGLIAMVREGAFATGSRVLFFHTGGSAALHAYPEQVRPARGATVQRS